MDVPHLLAAARYQEIWETTDINQKDYSGAIALFERAAEFGDDNEKTVCKTNIGNAWYNTGLALSQVGNYEDAIKAFNSALDNGLNTIDVYLFRGYAYLFFKQYQQAIMDFETILEVMPDNLRVKYLFNVAVVYLQPSMMNGDVEKWFKDNPVEGLKKSGYKTNNDCRHFFTTTVRTVTVGNTTIILSERLNNFPAMGCGSAYRMKNVMTMKETEDGKYKFDERYFPEKAEEVF